MGKQRKKQEPRRMVILVDVDADWGQELTELLPADVLFSNLVQRGSIDEIIGSVTNAGDVAIWVFNFNGTSAVEFLGEDPERVQVDEGVNIKFGITSESGRNNSLKLNVDRCFLQNVSAEDVANAIRDIFSKVL